MVKSTKFGSLVLCEGKRVWELSSIFLAFLCVSNHVIHAYAHAHFSNERVIANCALSCAQWGGVWIAITRDFEHDICVTSKILQSDWTLPNRAPVPRKSTKVPRPSFRMWAGRSGHENINLVWVTLMLLHTYVWICHIIRKGLQYACIITTYHMRSLKKLSMTTYSQLTHRQH